MPNATVTKLDDTNSRCYRSKPGQPKRATLKWQPAQYELTWGRQSFDGPHIVVSSDDEEYGVDLRVFFATHRPVREQPDHYVKDAIVRAVQVREPTDIVTRVDGREEMQSTVPAGGWIIQNPAGELYSNTDEKFEQTYEPT